MNYVELAKAYAKAGYGTIPVTSEKLPALREWGRFQVAPMSPEECEIYFKNPYGIALLSGGVKKITILDFDMKYDLTGDLFDRFKKAVPIGLLQKMYVQSTKNSGFHFIFSCDIIEPNQKLASRYATVYEKHKTYMEAFNNEKTRDKALKISSNLRQMVTIETRGGSPTVCGGYALMSPSPGYKHIYGKINHISNEEYNLLMETARSFNEVVEVKKDIRLDKYKEWKISPFESFNEKGDVLKLLYDSGWEECNNGYGNSVRLRRAGAVTSASSALFDPETRLLNVFSTSTIFDVNRAYSPSDVFIKLECDDDLSVAFRKLIEMGYGEEK